MKEEKLNKLRIESTIKQQLDQQKRQQQQQQQRHKRQPTKPNTTHYTNEHLKHDPHYSDMFDNIPMRDCKKRKTQKINVQQAVC
jgi:hypothetical protein